MSPTAKVMLPRAEAARSALLGKAHQGRGNVDRHDVGAAPRRLDRQGAGAAAGVQQAQPVHVGRQPGEQRSAHGVAPGAHGGANAPERRIRGQTLPRFDRGAIEIGFQFVATGDV